VPSNNNDAARGQIIEKFITGILIAYLSGSFFLLAENDRHPRFVLRCAFLPMTNLGTAQKT